MLELDIPDEGLAVAAHAVPYPGVPIAPVANGLTPGDVSSVAPRGIPVGGTSEPGVMPSDEVAPIVGVGLPPPPICAKTGSQPKSVTSIAAVAARRIVISIVRRGEPTGTSSPGQPANLLSVAGFVICCLLDLANFAGELLHSVGRPI